jgi:protein kinase-like protein
VDPINWHFGGVQEVVAKRSALTVGRVFAGHYRIDDTLGKGGMGAVYRAHDQELGRDVAIKVTQNPLDEQQRGRFLREGEVTAALDHPGIVRVHGGGVTDDGLPFLVLELVEGARDLRTTFEGAPLEERLRLLVDVGRALGHAHARGVIHRDVKPSNVLVDAEGRARVCDFGLGWSEGKERLTRTGAFVGTPAYASPEQWVTGPAGSRPTSDVWSLGVLLYEALTGVHPFSAATVVATLALVQDATPTPASDLIGDVAQPVQRVVERALSRDPARRYADGAQFADALQAAMETEVPTHSGAGKWIASAVVLVGLGVALSTRAFATPVTPTATPTPSPQDADQGREAWAALEKQPPAARLTGAQAWIEAHPTHPDRARVEEAIAALRQEVPRLSLQHGPPGREVRACYAQGKLWTYGSDVCAWNLRTGALETRLEVGAVGRHLLPTRRGVLAPLQGEFVWIEGQRVVRRAQASLAPREVLLASPEPDVWVVTGPSALRYFPAASPYQLPDGLLIVAAAAGPKVVVLIGLDPKAPLEMGAMVLFDPVTREASPRMMLPSQTRVVACSPDGEAIALGTLAGHVFLCDATGKIRRKLTRKLDTSDGDIVVKTLGDKAHYRQVQDLAFSADGRLLHSISRGERSAELDPNTWVTWDLGTGSPVRIRNWRELRPTSIHVDPEGRSVALGSAAGIVEVWKAE